MATFTGTASGDDIYEGYISPGASRDPANSYSGATNDTIHGNGGGSPSRGDRDQPRDPADGRAAYGIRPTATAVKRLSPL